jgi:hypothetical protein
MPTMHDSMRCARRAALRAGREVPAFCAFRAPLLRAAGCAAIRHAFRVRGAAKTLSTCCRLLAAAKVTLVMIELAPWMESGMLYIALPGFDRPGQGQGPAAGGVGGQQRFLLRSCGRAALHLPQKRIVRDQCVFKSI